MENNNIWNDVFQKENMIWGIEPSNVAKITEKIFLENGIKTIDLFNNHKDDMMMV
jgi:hypothetical protein